MSCTANPMSGQKFKRVVEFLLSDAVEQSDYNLFRPLYDDLLSGGDQWMVLFDFRSYLEAQATADELYRKPDVWAKIQTGR